MKKNKKESLKEVCGDLIKKKAEENRSRLLEINQKKHKEEEEKMMEMIYGPNWKNS